MINLNRCLHWSFPFTDCSSLIMPQFSLPYWKSLAWNFPECPYLVGNCWYEITIYLLSQHDIAVVRCVVVGRVIIWCVLFVILLFVVTIYIIVLIVRILWNLYSSLLYFVAILSSSARFYSLPFSINHPFPPLSRVWPSMLNCREIGSDKPNQYVWYHHITQLRLH